MKYKHNGMRFNEIDKIFDSLERYYDNLRHGDYYNSLHRQVESRSLEEWKIIFDVHGGIREYFENNDILMKLEKENDVYFSYILDEVGSLSCFSDITAKKFKDTEKELFYMILDNGIFDNIFLSFKTEKNCLKWFNATKRYHYDDIWLNDINFHEYYANKMICSIRKRIKFIFKNVQK